MVFRQSTQSATGWAPPAESESTAPQGPAASVLRVLLEAIPAATMVVRANGVVVQTNRRGRQYLASKQVDRMVPSFERWGETFRVERLDSSGGVDHYLLVHRKDRGSDDRTDDRSAGRDRARATRLQQRAVEWGLTPRQRTVLDRVLDGASNVRIASELGVSRRTIEQHVSVVLHRTGCHSRSELIALFWS